MTDPYSIWLALEEEADPFSSVAPATATATADPYAMWLKLETFGQEDEEPGEAVKAVTQAYDLGTPRQDVITDPGQLSPEQLNVLQDSMQAPGGQVFDAPVPPLAPPPQGAVVPRLEAMTPEIEARSIPAPPITAEELARFKTSRQDIGPVEEFFRQLGPGVDQLQKSARNFVAWASDIQGLDEAKQWSRIKAAAEEAEMGKIPFKVETREDIKGFTDLLTYAMGHAGRMVPTTVALGIPTAAGGSIAAALGAGAVGVSMASLLAGLGPSAIVELGETYETTMRELGRELTKSEKIKVGLWGTAAGAMEQVPEALMLGFGRMAKVSGNPMAKQGFKYIIQKLAKGGKALAIDEVGEILTEISQAVAEKRPSGKWPTLKEVIDTAFATAVVTPILGAPTAAVSAAMPPSAGGGAGPPHVARPGQPAVGGAQVSDALPAITREQLLDLAARMSTVVRQAGDRVTKQADLRALGEGPSGPSKKPMPEIPILGQKETAADRVVRDLLQQFSRRGELSPDELALQSEMVAPPLPEELKPKPRKKAGIPTKTESPWLHRRVRSLGGLAPGELVPWLGKKEAGKDFRGLVLQVTKRGGLTVDKLAAQLGMTDEEMVNALLQERGTKRPHFQAQAEEQAGTEPYEKEMQEEMARREADLSLDKGGPTTGELQLKPGDKLKIRGEEYMVRPGPDPGTLILEDGQSFVVDSKGSSALNLGVMPPPEDAFYKLTPEDREALGHQAPRPISLKEVQDALPPAKVREGEGGYFYADFPSGIQLRIRNRDEIEINRGVARKARPTLKGFEQAIGSWQKLGRGGVISLVDKGAVNRETFEAAMDLVLTPREKAALKRKYAADERRRGVSWTELAADEYSEYKRGRISGQEVEMNFWRRLWAKNYEAMQRLRHMLFPSAESTFEEVASGRTWKRAAPSEKPVETGDDLAGQVQDVARSVDGVIEDFIPPVGLSIRFTAATDTVVLPTPPSAKKTGMPSSVNPEVEKRWAAAHGLKRAPLLQRVKETAIGMAHSFTRQFPELDHQRDAETINTLRKVLAVPAYSRFAADQVLRGTMAGFGPQRKNVFERAVILPDLLRDIEAGLYDRIDGEGLKDLPFGYRDPAEVQTDLDRFREVANANPDIKAALARRDEFIRRLTEQLVEQGFLPEDVLSDPRYFHHQVLEYMQQRQALGVSSRDVRLKTKGWQRARVGYSGDYNTEYIEAEGEFVAQAISHLKKKELLEELGEQDIRPELAGKAKRRNLEAVHGGAAVYARVQDLRSQIRAIHAEGDLDSGKRQQLRILHEELDPIDILAPFRAQKVRAKFSLKKNLETMHNEEGLVVPEKLSGAFEELLMEGAEEGYEPMEESGGSFFDLLAWASKHPVGRISGPANGFFKGIQDEKRFIQETLKDKFLTAEDLAPEGWVEWQPKPGNLFYEVNGLADRVVHQMLEQVARGGLPEGRFTADDVKQVLAVGPKRTSWIIPENVAATLESLARGKEEGAVSAFARSLQSTWKQHILLNPIRFLRYNLNNASGDLDIVIAYNPKILGEAWAAARDLYAYTRGKSAVKDIHAALERAVIDSGLTITDIPSISESGFFRVLTGQDVNAIERYFESAREWTSYRENILRLAAYRWFLKEIKAGRQPYGASRREYIDGISDPQDKAAALASDLLGNYRGTSPGTKWISDHLHPFFRWSAINAPRYYRLLANARYEGGGGKSTVAAAGRVAAVTAGKAGRTYVSLAVRATALYALVTMWNRIVFPDEEEKLGYDQRRQLHLILPYRRENGELMTVRFQGALSDALSWFALEDFPQDAMDIVQGKVPVKEKLKEMVWAPVDKVLTGASPFLKMPFELATGKSLYPEPRDPRTIRDRGEHLARMWSLDSIYRRVRGMPYAGAEREILSLVFYFRHPDEAAYNTIRSRAYEWLGQQGKPPVYPEPKRGSAAWDRTQSLYYWRQAQRYGDTKAEEKYRQKYLKAGGKEEGMKKSIERSGPLAMLTKADRAAFLATLTPKDRELWKAAEAWYESTYVRKK